MKVACIFPGAWSRNSASVWMRHIFNFLIKRGYTPILMRYQGTSHADIVSNCLLQLERHRKVIDNAQEVIGVGYSMGGSILRGVAKQRPGIFQRVILIASTSHRGLPWLGVIKGILTIPQEFVLGFLTKVIVLSHARRIRKLFGLTTSNRIIRILRPEPFLCCLQLIPCFHGNKGLLKCPVVAIVPRDDVLFSGVTYSDPQLQLISVSGGHGIVLKRAQIRRALELAVPTTEN